MKHLFTYLLFYWRWLIAFRPDVPQFHKGYIKNNNLFNYIDLIFLPNQLEEIAKAGYIIIEPNKKEPSDFYNYKIVKAVPTFIHKGKVYIIRRNSITIEKKLWSVEETWFDIHYRNKYD